MFASDVSSDCTGPMKIHKETKACIFDVEYPKLSNSQKECEVRKWIDDAAHHFSYEGMDLDPDMHRKNECWISSDVTQSGVFESVEIEDYEYEQGANGSASVKTFVYDIKTGKEIELFDVLDPKKNWHRALNPFFYKFIDADLPSHQLDIYRLDGGLDSDPSVFKSFVLDEKNLILYFDQESVAPHSSGVVKIVIPMTEIKSVLTDSFKKAAHL